MRISCVDGTRGGVLIDLTLSSTDGSKEMIHLFIATEYGDVSTVHKSGFNLQYILVTKICEHQSDALW